MSEAEARQAGSPQSHPGQSAKHDPCAGQIKLRKAWAV